MPSTPLAAAATAGGASRRAARASSSRPERRPTRQSARGRRERTGSPGPSSTPRHRATKDLAIPMSDGVKLRADLTLPADADGNAISTKVPVVVTITAYNKTVIAGGFGGTLAGADPAYLVKRGYAQLTVDARGTGSSEGQWNAFDARENKDAAEVMTWAHKQPWSNGSTAMTGASYMGISQIFAAAGKPAGLKAIFPQVPAADVYRDVVASGGQVDSGFMPLWLGLVTATGLIPPAVAAPRTRSRRSARWPRASVRRPPFTGPTLVKAMAGQETAYDGPFYAERSPINVDHQGERADVPVAGEYDLFQRGTPLLYENLRKRGVPTKLIIGPWDHLQGLVRRRGRQRRLRPARRAAAALVRPLRQGRGRPDARQGHRADDLVRAGHRRLAQGRRTGSAATGSPRAGGSPAAPPTAPPAPSPPARRKDGTAQRAADPGRRALHAAPPTSGPPGSWRQSPFPNPCLEDNRAQRPAGVTFDSAPGRPARCRFQGPINARLYVSSTRRRRDALGSGRGCRTRRHRQAPHRRLAGHLAPRTEHVEVALPRREADPGLPPAHEGCREAAGAGAVEPVDVEIFPTGASIEKGHRLRIAVQAFDTPHLAPTLPQLPGHADRHHDPQLREVPVELTLPAVR